MGVTINSVSTRGQVGAEYLLLDSGAQLHACPIKYPGQKVPLLDRGIHTASELDSNMTEDDWCHTRLQFRNQSCLLVVVHCSFLARSRAKHSQTQLHKEESPFFVKGVLVAPLSTASVSDEVAQELQMPMGPQVLEDVEEPMLACFATLTDPGTPHQIVMEQHSLAHFPSQHWCKKCVESRRRDSPQREQSKIDAVATQLQFDGGYMGDGSPLQIACFFVGADTSSGAIHATMVPDSKKMDMSYVVAATAKWVRDLVYERFCLHGEKRRSSSVATGQGGNRMSS